MLKDNPKATTLLLDHMSASSTKPKMKAFAAGAIQALPQPPDPQLAKEALTFLDAFGYLKDELLQWADISIGDIIDAIKAFQLMYNLPVTGELSTQTARAMQMPRCGHPDIPRPRFAKLQAAATSLNRWTKTSITYTIQSVMPGIAASDLQKIIANAFAAWSQYAKIDIRPAQQGEQPDILIGTGQGTQEQFDGPNGVLAWCYLPDGSDQPLQMKFDLAEHWLTQPGAGILIANVATHELGHGLGLTHSKVQSALMAPYYNANIATPQQNDDIPRIVARYGARTGAPTPTTPAPVPPPTPVPTPASSTITVIGDLKSVILNGTRIV